MLIHTSDGRILTVEYNTISVQEIIEYDDEWYKEKEPTRTFAIHDRWDEHYWLQEHYEKKCRSKAETTTSHGYVLMCGAEVLMKLQNDTQGHAIVQEIAQALNEGNPIFYLDIEAKDAKETPA